MSDIIDNRTVRLEDAVRQALSASVSADWAVGYIYFSGLVPLLGAIGGLERLRLLLGNRTDRQTLEQLVESHHSLELARKTERQCRFRNPAQEAGMAGDLARDLGAVIARMPQEDPAESGLRRLRDLVAEDRIQARMYPRGRLHAKAYIFDYRQDGRFERGMGIVGSSNLTLAGLTANTELNVAVHGNDNHAQLKAWFESLWRDAVPIESAFREELDRSWALYPATPWDVYMKTLLTLVRDRLDDDGRHRSILIEDDVLDRLAEFQRDAVERGIRIIREHGGVFIADVVGLGKSFIGSAIARHFRRAEGRKILILCPAALTDMWEEYSRLYDLNARILSTGLLRQQPDCLMTDTYFEYDFVLLDESHHFRHPTTRQYQALEHFIHQRRPMMCLLTATPQNKGPWDIYHQLRLFQREQEITLPIATPDLKAWFHGVETGEQSLPALLKMVLVRRTRRHILRWYGTAEDTGRPLRDLEDAEAAPYLRGERPASVRVGNSRQFFPRRRLVTLSYSIDDTYRGLYDRIRDLLTGEAATAGGEVITYARFDLGTYVLKEYRNKKPYDGLRWGGRNLRGLMRILMFKRLESSVYAFRRSVEKMLRANQLFLEGLGQGIIIARDAGLNPALLADKLFDEGQLPDKEDWDELRQASPYKAGHFDIPSLRRDIEADIAVLRELMELVEPIVPDQDAKLNRFLRGMNGEFLRNSGKVLVFTQFADTAEYLYEHVRVLRPGDDVALVRGTDAGQSRIAARFAPRANRNMTAAPGPEINILIATDVMSEGLNLQDCDVIVNYDLHWNPVRLIQRFGRIDRIGTDNAEIWGFNFLPEAGIERNLGLTEVLRARIREIHQVIGEDTQILEETETLNESAIYAIYEEKESELAAAEEGDETILDLVEAEAFFRRMREENPEEFERIQALRDGIRCARAGVGPAAIALCQAGSYLQFYRIDRNEVTPTDIETALKLLRCAPDTPGLPLPAGHNSRVSAILARFREDVERRQNQQHGAIKLRPGQNYVIRRLREIAAQSPDHAVRQFCDTLLPTIGGPLPAVLHQQLNTLRNLNLSNENLLRELKKLYLDYGLDRIRPQNDRNEEDAVPCIITSEGFVSEAR